MAHRALRTRLGRTSRPASPAPVAPTAATQRLSGALRHHADRYRSDAALDLTLIDALVRMDELEAAADTLEGHRESLQALARDLQEVVADAAEQRDATVDAVGLSGIRRRMMAVTSAAAVLLTLMLPAGRTLPRTILAAVEGRWDQAGDATPAPLTPAPAVRTRTDRRTDSASLPTENRRSLGKSMARDTVRAILAADIAGGSAAENRPRQDGKVISLDAARAARRQVRQDVTAAPDADEALPPMPPRPPVDESQMETLDAVVEPADLDLP